MPSVFNYAEGFLFSNHSFERIVKKSSVGVVTKSLIITKMDKIRITLSAGEFYRAVELEYYCLWVPRCLQVAKGDLLLLEKIDNKGFDVDYCTIVREVVDWDCVDFMDSSKKCYQAIVRNNNYLS